MVDVGEQIVVGQIWGYDICIQIPHSARRQAQLRHQLLPLKQRPVSGCQQLQDKILSVQALTEEREMSESVLQSLIRHLRQTLRAHKVINRQNAAPLMQIMDNLLPEHGKNAMPWILN